MYSLFLEFIALSLRKYFRVGTVASSKYVLIVKIANNNHNGIIIVRSPRAVPPEVQAVK